MAARLQEDNIESITADFQAAERAVKHNDLAKYLRERGMTDLRSKTKSELIRLCAGNFDPRNDDLLNDLAHLLRANVLIKIPTIYDYSLEKSDDGPYWCVYTRSDSPVVFPGTFCGLPIQIKVSTRKLQVSQGDGPIASSADIGSSVVGLITADGMGMHITAHSAGPVGSIMTHIPTNTQLGTVVRADHFRDLAYAQLNAPQQPSLPLCQASNCYAVGRGVHRPATHQTAEIAATIVSNRAWTVLAMAPATQPHSQDGDSNMVYESPNRGHSIGIHVSYDAGDRTMSIVKVCPQRTRSSAVVSPPKKGAERSGNGSNSPAKRVRGEMALGLPRVTRAGTTY